MNSFVLLLDGNSDWSPRAWVESIGGNRISDEQVLVEIGTDWLSVVRSDQTLDDFDESERIRLADLVKEPAVYLVEWRGSSRLVEELLRSVPAGVRAAVDNDHGLLVPLYQVAGEPLDVWVRATPGPTS